jgi:hypothetical protein
MFRQGSDEALPSSETCEPNIGGQTTAAQTNQTKTRDSTNPKSVQPTNPPTKSHSMNGATKDASGVSHAGRVFFYFRQPAYVNNEELLPEDIERATKLPVSSKKPVAA